MDVYKMGLRPTSPTRPITPDCPRSKYSSRFGMWQKLQHFFGRDGSIQCVESDDDVTWSMPDQPKTLQRRNGSCARPVGVGLPRKATFRRQNSEKRERLCPHELTANERRTCSMSRPSSTALTKFRSNSVPTTALPTRCSAPAVTTLSAVNGSDPNSIDVPQADEQPPSDAENMLEFNHLRPPRPASVTSSSDSYDDQADYFEDRNQLNRELDTRWILNLSMHFRDKSDREKFFVTYAETPSHWRRVTVSCDYRNAEPGSLEMDLKELQLQRDKSMQIYEAVRDSLLEIKFYDTVTNLKLETSDGRLHVHVTEDVNEIIPYPPISSLHHILQDSGYRPKLICESELSFEAHLSGFVYKVIYQNKAYIKKEIPGPDTVDEFLYEVNALHALQDSQYVIDLEAIVTDDSGELIKGLLIDYAERGAVVDLLYDEKGEIPWEDRERWARHAIQGLSDVHEEGYVQGDFTLSNIVVDKHNNARIIDINRRGCPVGWEPPEIAKKIASNQRISMYIGQKSDLYQLGMTLWALAMDDDEPERHDPPLSTQEFPADVPDWYQDIVRNCLSVRPRDRPSATDLIKSFPPEGRSFSGSSRHGRPIVHIRTGKQYIDPADDVSRDDLERFRYERNQSDEILYSPESSREDPTYTWPQSSNYDRDYDSASSEIERPRGRRRISDHDLLLQAQQQQRQDTRVFNESPIINGAYNDHAPVISISNDGTEMHIVDVDDDEPPIEVEHIPSEDGSFDPTPYSLGHLQNRRMLRAYSETSDETPRNDSFPLLSSEIHSPDYPNVVSQSEGVPDDLAGLGSHPNVSEHSLEQVHENEEDANERIISHLPSLQFMDSGFDEPSKFEIELHDPPDEQLQGFNADTVEFPIANEVRSDQSPAFEHRKDTDIAVPLQSEQLHLENELTKTGNEVSDNLTSAAPETILSNTTSFDTDKIEGGSLASSKSEPNAAIGVKHDSAASEISISKQDPPSHMEPDNIVSPKTGTELANDDSRGA